MNCPPGPLLLRPVFLPKVWAAPELAGPLGEVFNPPPGIGEIWLASDRHQVTKVARGESAGRGLDEVLSRHAEEILGPGQKPPFPLLLKILSVGQWLSVQVHPDDTAARRLENEPWGKNEAWCILEAAPGAEIIMGVTPGTGRAELTKALAQGRLPEALARVPARSGDVFDLPAGTVHATGPGLVILEVQQASDVTYRFYDWDRPGQDGKPRPLHQKKALEVMKLQGPGRVQTPETLWQDSCGRGTLLLSNPYFALLKWEAKGKCAWRHNEPACRLVFVLAGRGLLHFAGERYAPAPIAAGQCWLLPANLPPTEVQPEAGELIFFECLARAI